GDPYVTSRARGPVLPEKVDLPQSGKQEGMGLGVFIAKTLIEQTGGLVIARNGNQGGAIVNARRARGAIDGDVAPKKAFKVSPYTSASVAKPPLARYVTKA